MRYPLVALSMLLGMAAPARAQLGVGVDLPGIDIGVHFSAFPRLVLVPGYPVYYDPRADSNYFFYDGLYWVYQDDDWYASTWYDGPWQRMGPDEVPLFVLRVPVRYYRRPPVYFSGWRAEAPPRWDEHWGRSWGDHRRGWDRWDRHAAPRAAPLPAYQRRYSGDRYPRAPEQQVTIRSQNYRYRPREPVVRERFAPQVHPGGGRPEPQHGSSERSRQAQRDPQRPHQGGLARPDAAQPGQPSRPAQEPRGMRPASGPQGGPQDRGRERKPGPQGRDRDGRDDERGPERR